MYFANEMYMVRVVGIWSGGSVGELKLFQEFDVEWHIILVSKRTTLIKRCKEK